MLEAAEGELEHAMHVGSQKSMPEPYMVSPLAELILRCWHAIAGTEGGWCQRLQRGSWSALHFPDEATLRTHYMMPQHAERLLRC